jgi:uncharacterized protein (TIGR01244 family)
MRWLNSVGMVLVLCGGPVFADGGADFADGGADFADDSAEYFSEPVAQGGDGFTDIFSQVAPNVYMAGQPTRAGLERAKSLGVTRVINLRTQMEMDNREIVPFDEAAAIEALGLEYVHIPLGGPNTPYTPAAVDQLATSLVGAEGNVLLHCTVAWRATHLWTAYLIKHQQLSFVEAVDIGRKLNLGRLPLEGFVGAPLTLELRDE